MLRVLYPLACASDRLRVLKFGRCKRFTPSPASFRMKVYTRTGDAGQTSLFNGRRVSKNHSRVEAYGTVDECNAAVGMACAHLSMRDVAAVGEYRAEAEAALEGLRLRLESLQHCLFDLGAHLATPRDTSTQAKLDKTAFPSNAAKDIEAWIDDMEATLPPLTAFILPRGHPSAAALHVARTIARRAERAVTPMLHGDEPQIDPAAYQFLNRLSDFFFVASRYANKLTGYPDVTWSKQHDTSRVP